MTMLQDLKYQYSLINRWGSFITKEEFGFLLETIDEQQKALKQIIDIKNNYSDGDDTFMHVDDPYLYEAIEIAEKSINESKEN